MQQIRGHGLQSISHLLRGGGKYADLAYALQKLKTGQLVKAEEIQVSIIEAQGKSQAEAMREKAESFKNYNEAAVIEMMVRILPEVAGKMSEPLAETEKIVIINSGNGPGGGASKFTGDVTQIVSQLPPVIASLTGIKFEKLLEQIPALRNAMEGDASSKS